MRPTGSTRLAGVIGDPVRHSLSPVLHNAAFAALGLDWVYVALPVPAGKAAAAVDAARLFELGGLSVTMPHKTAVASALDELSDDARLLGAVNTVVPIGGGRLRGESTDGPGFLAALGEAGFDPAGKRCVVIGAGGAGRAVVLALARAGARSIVVVNRDAAKAHTAAALGGSVAAVGVAERAAEADLVVNATPVGMGAGVMPLDEGLLSPGQWVNDLIYHPSTTPLLAAARRRGASAVGGIGMLLHQAGRQLELWTGASAPLAAMRQAVEQVLAARADAG